MKDGFHRCPKCGSSSVYQEVSLRGKMKLGTQRIVDVNLNNPVLEREAGCSKCGWRGSIGDLGIRP